MQRSISTLLTTLLFSTAILPNAMAQMQQSSFPVSLSISSASSTVVPAQPASDLTKPVPTQTEVLPEPVKSSVPPVRTMNAEKSHPRIDRTRVDSSYPAYCPPLPPGTKPEDWAYSEALEKCLYGI